MCRFLSRHLVGRAVVLVAFAVCTQLANVGRLWSSVSPRVDLGGIVDRCALHRFQSAWCPYPSARGSRVRTKPECLCLLAREKLLPTTTVRLIVYQKKMGV